MAGENHKAALKWRSNNCFDFFPEFPPLYFLFSRKPKISFKKNLKYLNFNHPSFGFFEETRSSYFIHCFSSSDIYKVVIDPPLIEDCVDDDHFNEKLIKWSWICQNECRCKISAYYFFAKIWWFWVFIGFFYLEASHCSDSMNVDSYKF